MWWDMTAEYGPRGMANGRESELSASPHVGVQWEEGAPFTLEGCWTRE